MTIATATLAGSTNNQDRLVVGDGFAAVLDGATSVAGDRSHDPGWYAEQLALSLRETVPRGGPLADAVTDAIRAVRDAHALVPETTPTSTVALARWSGEAVETYVLGDSVVAVLRTDGSEAVRTDDRLDAVAVAERASYRARLAAGHGYDGVHRALLVHLQAEQGRLRNRHGGYWIAGAEPDAGLHGLTATEDRATVAALVLASDGVVPERSAEPATWRDLHREAERHGPEHVLERLHAQEATDPDGQRWPRAKPHDDKTLVTVTLDGRH